MLKSYSEWKELMESAEPPFSTQELAIVKHIMGVPTENPQYSNPSYISWLLSSHLPDFQKWLNARGSVGPLEDAPDETNMAHVYLRDILAKKWPMPRPTVHEPNLG